MGDPLDSDRPVEGFTGIKHLGIVTFFLEHIFFKDAELF